MSTYHPADLELLIQHRLAEALAAGHPPKSLDAWRRAAIKAELANERAHPGFITRAADGLLEQRTGQRITGWREVHSPWAVDWIYDPQGTAMPLKEYGYSLAWAKERWEEGRRKRNAPT